MDTGNTREWTWKWRVGYATDGRKLAPGNYRILIYNCGDIQDESDAPFTLKR